MIRLIYTGSINAQQTPEQLTRLIEDSRNRNLRDGICGVMVLVGQDFLQVIEGKGEDVERYYRQVFSDKKRYNLTLLARQTIQVPIFDAWSLGFIKGEPATNPYQPTDQTLLQIEQINPKNQNDQRTLSLIQEFIDGKWHHHQPGIYNLVTVRRNK